MPYRRDADHADRAFRPRQLPPRQRAAVVPFAEAQFDVVWTQHSSMNVENKERLYAEIRRVLRPGGRLALHEIMSGPVQPVHFPVPWARDPAISFLRPPAEIRALLTGTGFADRLGRHLGAAVTTFRERPIPPPNTAASPLGLHVLLGPELRDMSRNILRNLEGERIVVIRRCSIDHSRYRRGEEWMLQPRRARRSTARPWCIHLSPSRSASGRFRSRESPGMTIFGTATTDAPRFDDAARRYDALLVLSFGGPRRTGRRPPVPRKRHRRAQRPSGAVGRGRRALPALRRRQPDQRPEPGTDRGARSRAGRARTRLPIYFGNRNWHPFATDTIRAMREDGVERALVFVTSAFSSYSGCRQYREDVIRALETLDAETPAFDKLRVFYNHPGFINPMVARTRTALDQIPAERRHATRLVFTAHSIPLAMARHCAYEAQLREASRLIAGGVGVENHRLAYQSRSGPPQVPWLEPDILDVLAALRDDGATDVVVVPVGFISDHMEILFDLDTEARETAANLGLNLVRAQTVGTDPAFVRMIRDLIVERTTVSPERPLGNRGPSHDVCPLHCCLIGSARPAMGAAG